MPDPDSERAVTGVKAPSLGLDPSSWRLLLLTLLVGSQVCVQALLSRESGKAAGDTRRTRTPARHCVGDSRLTVRDRGPGAQELASCRRVPRHLPTSPHIHVLQGRSWSPGLSRDTRGR